MVRKATLEKVMLFQKRFKELSEAKDDAIEPRLTAYCLYLILKDTRPEITEQWVLENAPGDLGMFDVIEQFGFLNRQKVESLRMRNQRNAPTQQKPTEEQIG